MVDEVNETAWPGYDLRTNKQGQYAYGFIPPASDERTRGRAAQGGRELAS
jgi:hypothetical protein